MRDGRGENRRAGEAQVGQPLGGGALVAQHPEVPVRRAQLVADLAEGQQPGVRVALAIRPRAVRCKNPP